MIQALFRILFGYAVAVASATSVTLIEMTMLVGGGLLSWREAATGFAVIGAFAWAGLIFAIRGKVRGWIQSSTYAAGGLIAMLVGVATLGALGLGQGLMQGYLIPDLKMVGSFLYNMAQLIALGILPGLAGGLTYWLVAVEKSRAIA